MARAGAASVGLPLFRYVGGPNAHLLPVPMMNILNGGAHADTAVDIQEFMIAPIGADTFADALRWGAEVYHSLKAVLKSQGLATGLGDEGGFAPDLPSNRDALDLIGRAIEQAGFQLGQDVVLALDVAATEFHSDGVYTFEGNKNTAEQMADYYADLLDNYPLVSIEDPLDEEDWAGWKALTERVGAPGAARRRRPVRHQSRAVGPRHRREDRERAVGEGQSDRHVDRRPSTRSTWPTATGTGR